MNFSFPGKIWVEINIKQYNYTTYKPPDLNTIIFIQPQMLVTVASINDKPKQIENHVKTSNNGRAFSMTNATSRTNRK